MPQTVLSKKSSKVVKILVGTFFIIGLVSIFFYLNTTFNVKTIIINKNKVNEVVYGIDELKNISTLLISKDNIVDSLKKSNPRIKVIKVAISYPATLIVNLEFESDFINLQTNNGYFILDNRGKILEKRKTIKDRLPLLTYYQKIDHSSFSPGNFVNYRDILIALYFVENTERLGLFVNTVDIGSLYMVRLKIEDKTVIFSTEKEKEIQMYELSSILKRYQSIGDKYKIIDLRFDKPVLKISD